ncbi:MAG: alpha-hydroxy-acid oxidizing protein [Proteobacteria bacterium]|nr:alpha-hydroxy-acid oxidizing protein [Pseudomonadota bacterium]
MAKWICTVCKYVHTGNEPPDKCPVCCVGPEKFIRVPDAEEARDSESSVPPKTLDEVRDRARQRLSEICAVYPTCNGEPDRMCQREAYGAPIGLGGAGSGASFAANYNALSHLRLRTQLIGNHFEPDTDFNFFGKKLSMPVMGASTAGPGRYTKEITEGDFCLATIRGCREAGALSWRGDTFFYTPQDNPALEALEAENGHGVPIFKPRSQDVLKRLFERAEKRGCPAVGVDLDGCGSTIMARHGQPVFRKSPEDIQELVESTSLPFIAKGIMIPEDAEACVEAGARVIAVSNHGGRVLDSTPGVAEVLPSIVERIGERAMITADGGVRTGYDVLKMLALGADAVLIGRDVIRAAIGGGEKGVKLHMEHVRTVLRHAMTMTGCPDLQSIGSQVFV